MESKRCTKCKEELPIESFSKKGTGRGPRCRPCVAEYYRNYYHNNPERKKYIKARTRVNAEKAKQRAIQIVLEAFASGCVDCGETDIRVLEFDHQGDKESDVSYLMACGNISKLEKEMKKCEVVCANHHRIRTAKQFNTWRHAAVYPQSDKLSKG